MTSKVRDFQVYTYMETCAKYVSIWLVTDKNCSTGDFIEWKEFARNTFKYTYIEKRKRKIEFLQ